jgi:hypothetical protein
MSPMARNPHIALMIAMPSRFAKEEPHDEDMLDREPTAPDHRLARDDHGDDALFNNEPHEELISRIFHGIRNGDETAARATLTLCRCLEKMVHARNESELRKWCAHCSEVADKIPPSDEGEEDDELP